MEISSESELAVHGLRDVSRDSLYAFCGILRQRQKMGVMRARDTHSGGFS